MNATKVLLELVNGYKTYSAAILTIVAGIGAILSKNYSAGVADLMQAMTLIFGGAAVVGLRHAVAKVPTEVGLRHAVASGPCEVGLRHAVADGPTEVGLRHAVASGPCEVGLRHAVAEAPTGIF